MDEYLRRAASNQPDATALVDADQGNWWTYRELTNWAGSIADELRNRGVDPGDAVALVATRSPESVAAIWGIFRRGGVVVPLDPTEASETIRSKVDRAGVNALVTTTTDAGTVPEFTAKSVPEIEVTPQDTVEQKPEIGDELDSVARGIDEIRVVLFTSGTTGDPTGVRLTGRNLGASAASTVERLGVTTADRWLLDLPLYHTGGLSIPIRTAMLGATTVLRRSFEADGMASTIESYAVTGVSLVPTMLDRLLDAEGNLDSLQFVLVGGAATPPALTERALQAGLPVFPSYGMTETASGIATATPTEVTTNPETVGHPVTAASATIQDQEGNPVQAGEIGEIVVSGPIVSPGTIDGPNRRPGGRFHTGDRGYFSDAGRLFVTGRLDDLIITGGENVTPSEVKAAIRQAWPVEEVAVVGLSDEEWGEQVAAAVVPTNTASDFDPQKQMDALRKRLAPYKVPKTVELLESIPRTASGTVDRNRLRDALTDASGS